MFNFKKKSSQDTINHSNNENPYVKFALQEGDEMCKVTTQFSSNTDPERFGVLLSMIEKGFVGEYVVDTLVDYAKKHNLDDHTQKILDEMNKSSADFEDDIESMEYAKDFLKEFYPIAPSWGDPELLHMYDPTSRNLEPKTIRWQYLENREESFEDDDQEEFDESKPPKVYMMDGAPGLMSEEQFRRLQDSEKPNYEVPPYEMRIGYTNFTLGESAHKIIANANGIEYIKVIGRYSVIIAIGKMFDFGKVRREIEDKLGIKRENSVEQ